MPDTIVALSSPPLATAGREFQRAIVRLSGPRAFDLADAVFKITIPEPPRKATRPLPPRPMSLRDAAQQKSWRRLPGTVSWRAHDLSAHAYVMPAPYSYTREDIVELHLPALAWAIDDLIDTLKSHGARPAQPGEFTRRAFEHGRITLEQAESVGRLIAGTSAAEARAHAQQLNSHLNTARQKLKSGLEELLSQVELGLDFAHEDVVVIAPEEIERRTQSLLADARKLAEASAHESARALSAAHLRVVLAGPTNAGKSMLFNALLGRDAAIVSPQRHTTRDTVEAPLQLTHERHTYTITLIDSAGAGSDAERSDSPLFSAGWDISLRAIRSADIVLLTLDRSTSVESQSGLDALAIERSKLSDVERVLVWTKCDLPASPVEQISNLATSSSFTVSALTGEGVPALRDLLAARAAELSRRAAEAHAAASAARRACARTIAASLERAAQALRESHGEDALAVELREAIHACWQAEGILIRHDAVTESALDKIFARFCIGK